MDSHLPANDRRTIGDFTKIARPLVVAYAVAASCALAQVPDGTVPPNPDTVVQAKVRAAKADGRRFVRPRWTKAQVLDAIGEPDRKESIGYEKWTYLPTLRDPQTVTTIVFDADSVVDVQRDVLQ